MDAQQPDSIAITNQDLAVKDAFLVFRVMAKICAKPLETELDMRSHAVRSKLLSLHIIYSIIKDHIDVFLSHNIFYQEMSVCALSIQLDNIYFFFYQGMLPRL